MKRYISWNVNGLRAAEKKGFADSMLALNADCICIQETKLQAGQTDLELPGYESYWSYAEKKGYSGTAVFTRTEPLSVRYNLGIPEHDTEGRAVTGWSASTRRMRRTVCGALTTGWPGRTRSGIICVPWMR